MSKLFLFQAIQFSQTVLIQTIQFSISMQLVSIEPIDMALSSALNPGQSGPGSNGNEGMFHISQSSSITGTTPSDCLVSYQDTHWSGGGVLLHCRGAFGVFHSRLGNYFVRFLSVKPYKPLGVILKPDPYL